MIKAHYKSEISSNKSFGIVFFIFFLFLSIYFYLSYEAVNYILLVVSLIFLFLGIINSKLLTPLNILWTKFGFLLGKIISPIIMGVIFFAIITPTSLLMKILKKDILNLKYNNMNTYWIEKKESLSNMKNQF